LRFFDRQVEKKNGGRDAAIFYAWVLDDQIGLLTRHSTALA
jgi:hypothetical protein